MLGIVIQIVLSWAMLYFIEKKHLQVLGLIPNRRTALEFVLGFVTAVLVCVVYFLLQGYFSGTQWMLNNSYAFSNFLNSFWWVIKSVLFEEFIFRGALLYILIGKMGLNKACVISAVAFGVYHWFSYGVLGSPVQMIFVFLLTGTAGLMFSYSYALTKSMLLPIALHLGWNAASLILFSQGTIGDQLFTAVGGEVIEDWISLALFIFQWFGLPLVVFFYLRGQSHATK